MKKFSTVFAFTLALLLPVAVSSSALAQPAPAPATTSGLGSGAGLGFGAAAFLGGVGGVQAAYDTSMWHAEALVGFNSRSVNNANNAPTATDIQVGVRGWYHLHHGMNSDFSVGGGIGFNHYSISNNGGSGTQTLLEPGAQARVFLTPNFALFGVGGLTIAFGDNTPANNGTNTGVALNGHVTGGFGFTYFFR